MSNESSNQNAQQPADAPGDTPAIKLARAAAFAHCNEHAYLPQTHEQANSWQPHEWVVAAIHTAALIASQPVGRRFQADVADWMGQCFLPSLYSNVTERGDRLLEEVLELLQSHGYDSARVPTLVNYVFGRPVGEPAQEVGGVMVTLAAYCSVAGLSMQADGQAELDRINQPEVMARIRAKQEAKNALHFDTPLPGNTAQPSPTDELPDIASWSKGYHSGYARAVADHVARQPVGSEEAQILPPLATERMLDVGWPYGEVINASFDREGAYADLLAAAPPAQAVNLGSVHAALKAAAKSLRTIADSTKDTEFLETASEIRAYANSRANCAEQALTDSQAVGNG